MVGRIGQFVHRYSSCNTRGCAGTGRWWQGVRGGRGGAAGTREFPGPGPAPDVTAAKKVETLYKRSIYMLDARQFDIVGAVDVSYAFTLDGKN